MKINYIECSPRGGRSHSSKIANQYIEQAKKKVKTQKKTHVWFDIDQELYKGNLLKKWFTT